MVLGMVWELGFRVQGLGCRMVWGWGLGLKFLLLLRTPREQARWKNEVGARSEIQFSSFSATAAKPQRPLQGARRSENPRQGVLIILWVRWYIFLKGSICGRPLGFGASWCRVLSFNYLSQ